MKKAIIYASECELFKKHKQILQYCVVGVTNTVISILAYNICLWLGGNYLLSGFSASAAGFVNSYYWNKSYVFKSKGKGTLQRFFLLYLSLFFFMEMELTLFIEVFHMNKSLAQLPAMVINTIIGYVMNKTWVFEGKNEKSKQSE